MFFYSALIGMIFFVAKIPTIGFYNTKAYQEYGYQVAASPVGKADLIRSFLPVLMGNNWFATCYLLFYLFTPPLYILINNIPRKTHLYLVALMTMVGTVISMIPGQNVLHASNLYYFFLGYFIASYIRKYNPQILNHIVFNIIASLSILCFVAAWKCALIILSEHFPFFKSETARFFNIGGSINKFPVLFACVLFFCVFKNLNLKHNKFVNLLASTTFGIYLLHVNGQLKYFIWHKIFCFDKFSGNSSFPLYVLLCVFVVFTLLSLIEAARKIIFDKTVNRLFPQ